jgi:tetratricopeptide (TPR) repeat protein
MAKRVNKKFLVVLTVVVVAGGVMAMAAKIILPRIFKKDPQALVAQSIQFEKEGKIDESINAYLLAIDADKSNLQRWVELGDLYLRHLTDDPQYLRKAYSAWSSALSTDPHYKPALQRMLDLHWAFMEVGAAASTYNDASEAAAKLAEADPTDRKAAMRLHAVEIRKALQRLPADEKQVKEDVQQLREMAKLDPADADVACWAVQGQMWLAEQAFRRGGSADSEAEDALAPVEPAIDAMVQGQEKNARMQWFAGASYRRLWALEQTVRGPEGLAAADAATRPSSPAGPATKPITAEARAARREALARKADSAATQPTKVPAGRFTPRVTAAFAAAAANAVPPGDGKPGTPDYVSIQLENAAWNRQLGDVAQYQQIIEHLAQQLPDQPMVRLAYSEAFRDDPKKRDHVLELLAAPLKLDGLSGIEAVKQKSRQPMIDYERIMLRLAMLDEERDPTQRKAKLDAITAEVKTFDGETSDQSLWSLDVHGRLALVQNKVPDGIKLLQSALDRWPEDLDPRRRFAATQVLANAYRLAGQTGQSERLLGGLVERYPSVPAYRAQWIEALRIDGQADEAAEQLKELKKLAPTAPQIPALEAELEGGKARDTFVEKLPEKTSDERLRKAVVLGQSGKTDEAIAMLEGIVTAEPKNLAALQQLVQMYLAGNRRDEASAAVARGVQVNPDNAKLKLLAEQLKQRTPEELEKWQLAQIQQMSDPFAKEVSLLDFYVNKCTAAGRRGDEAGAKKFAGEAEQHLVAAERLKPNEPMLTVRRFDLLLKQSRFDEADALLQRAAANPAITAGEVPMMRYQLAAARNDLKAAEAAARDITRDRPHFAIGWNFLGNVRMTQGRYDEAKNAYSSALERQGRNRDALVGLIKASYALDDVAEAKSYIDKGREALPDDPTFREFAFDHEFKYGNRDKVVADREQLYQAHPEDVGNTAALLEMYLNLVPESSADANAAAAAAAAAAADPKEKAILEKARKVSEDAVKRWPSVPRFTVAAARVKLAAGDFLGGERLIKDFGDANPAWAKVAEPLQLAAYYRAGGKPASAEEMFVKAVQQSNNDPQVRQQYAAFLSDAGRRDEAARQLEGIPGAEAARQRIELLAAAGKADEAEKALQAALAQNPESLELSNLQLQNWIVAGRLPDVQAAVKQRLAKNGADDSARYYGALAKTHQSPPDFAGAVGDLTDVLARNPKNANALALLAEARFGAGDVAGAIDDMDRAVQNAPLRADLRQRLIVWCATNGRPEMVVRLATEAVKNPSLSRNPTWMRQLASAQAATNDFANAERSITQAESMVPKQQLPEVQKEHLDILSRGRSFAKMLKLTDTMLAAGQKDWWVYMSRGLAKFGLRDRGAAQEFDAALATLDPEKDAAAAQAVVNSIAGTLGTPEALKRVAKWEQASPSWRVFAANLCAANKDYAGVVKHLQPLEATADTLTPAVRKDLYNSLGMSRMQSGDPAGAVEAFQKFLKEQPGDVLISNNVASLLSDAVKPPKFEEAGTYAKTAYDGAHAWAPGQARSAIYDTYGWILVQRGGKDLDEGIRVLQESIEEFPIVEAHYHLGEAYLQKQPPQPDEATDQLNRGMELINKAKREKKPYDRDFEAKIQDAQARASKLATALPPAGSR